jgi:hypothetical protein
VPCAAVQTDHSEALAPGNLLALYRTPSHAACPDGAKPHYQGYTQHSYKNESFKQVGVWYINPQAILTPPEPNGML